MSTTPKSDVTFTDPPGRHTDYDWTAIATKLKAQPEQWGLIFENDKHSRVVSLIQGSVKALRPSDGFEFRTSNNHYTDNPGGGRTRRCSLYARYVPPKRRRSN